MNTIFIKQFYTPIFFFFASGNQFIKLDLNEFLSDKIAITLQKC